MRTLSALLLAVLAFAAPAAAQTPAPAPVPGPSFFFSCVGDNKLQNGTTTVAWSETKPAASFQSGAGCGIADPGLFTAPVAGQKADGIFGGAYDGPEIKTLNVELYSLLVQRARVPADLGAETELLVDGEVVAGPISFRIVPETTGGTPDVADRYRFSLNGLSIPAGKHDIQLRVTSEFLDYQHGWVWGASEIPGGVQVNPLKAFAPKLK